MANNFKMNVTESVLYVGVNDKNIDLFEGQYIVPNGMAYNSYVILDDKIAVMDTVDANFKDEWLENLEEALCGRTPDYLVVSHMEPDHSANITAFTEKYPNALVVSSDKAFVMMKQFYGNDYSDRRLTVKDGDVLELGSHKLNFVSAPMVHWPEVMMSYESSEKIVFSADGFGKFGALDCDEEWACEARRYYIGIVGKYGMQVQNVLKKLSGLEINAICPLHGPVLKENLGYYLDLYNTWSSYAPETQGVALCYTSIYGNTKKAALLLAEMLEEKGIKVSVSDLARCDMAEAVEDAFRYSHLVLATTTYNNDVFPYMKEFIHHLTERGYQNRTVGIIENGSWAPTAAKTIKSMLEDSKNLTLCENVVTLRSALNETSLSSLNALAEELSK